MFLKDWKVPSKENVIFNNKLKVTNIHYKVFEFDMQIKQRKNLNHIGRFKNYIRRYFLCYQSHYFCFLIVSITLIVLV